MCNYIRRAELVEFFENSPISAELADLTEFAEL